MSPTAPRYFQIPIPEDSALLERMEKANAEELKKLDERLEEAEKTEGETEIADALRARATYFSRIGDKVIFLFARNISSINNSLLIGESYYCTGTCIREDAWCWFQNRYRSCASADRFLLR